jgi:hypothetical protein
MNPENLLDHSDKTPLTPGVKPYTVIPIGGVITAELPRKMRIRIPRNMLYIEGYGYVPKEKLGTT